MKKFFFASLIIISGYVLITTLATCFSIHFPCFYMDQWETIASYFSFRENHKLLRWFFEYHNEHQIALPRLFHVIDWKYFGGSNLSLIIGILGSQALYAVVFFVILRRAKISVWMNLSIVLWTLIFLFSSAQLENLSFGFQISFVSVFLFSFLSIFLFFEYLSFGKRWQLVCTFVFAILASYSMSNGMLIWPFLILVAAVRKSWRNLIDFGLFCIFFFGNYFTRTVSPELEGSSLGSFHSLGDLMHFVQFGFVYLGNPLGRVGFGLATVYAGLLIAYLGFLVWIAWVKRREIPHSVVALLIVSFFLVASAWATALGRFEMGIIQATSSRYTTPALLFSCCLLVITALLLRQKDLRKGLRITMGVWLLVVAVFTGYLVKRQGFYILTFKNWHINKEIAFTAIQNNTMDPFYFQIIHPRLKVHFGTIERLKKDPIFGKIYNFKAPDNRRIESPETPLAEVNNNKVHFLETISLDSKHSAYIVYGGLDANMKRKGDKLYIADPDGNWVGSGHIVNWFPQYWPFTDFDRRGSKLLFVVHMDAEALSPSYQLYIENGKMLSKIGDLRTDNVEKLFSANLLSFRQYRGVASNYQVVSHDPAWIEKGSYDGVPQYKQIQMNYGTWKAGFAATGELRLRIPDFAGHTELNIPYLSGPVIPNGCLTVIDNKTGKEIAKARPAPYSSHWMVIQFQLPAGLESIDLIVREDGKGWGQWMGIGPPAIN